MISLVVNGEWHKVAAPAEAPLLWVLRDALHLTGTRYGCGRALCGACTVLVDGRPVRSCQLPVGEVDGRAVTTIEGLRRDPQTGAVFAALHAAWVALDVPQCGYCQSGQLVGATALLVADPRPDDAAITAAMDGHLCRCGTYQRIRAAIHRAASELAGAHT